MHSDTYLPIGCRSHIAMQYGMESDSNPFCSGAKEFDLLGCQVLISKYSSGRYSCPCLLKSCGGFLPRFPTDVANVDCMTRRQPVDIFIFTRILSCYVQTKRSVSTGPIVVSQM